MADKKGLSSKIMGLKVRLWRCAWRFVAWHPAQPLMLAVAGLFFFLARATRPF
jgi:hypothetical protein